MVGIGLPENKASHTVITYPSIGRRWSVDVIGQVVRRGYLDTTTQCAIGTKGTTRVPTYIPIFPDFHRFICPGYMKSVINIRIVMKP